MADNFLSKFRRKNSSSEDNLEQVKSNVTNAPDNWHKKTQGSNRHDFRGYATSENKQRFNQNDNYPEDDNNEEKFGGFVFNNNSKKNNEQKKNMYSNNNNYSNNYSNYPNNQKSNPHTKKSNPKLNQNPLNKKKQNNFQNTQQQVYQKDYNPSEEQLSELEKLQQHLLTCGISIGPNDNEINQPSNLQSNTDKDNDFAELLNQLHEDDSEHNHNFNYEQQFNQQVYIEAEKKKNDKKKPKKKKQKNKNPQYQQQMHIINNPPEFSNPGSFDPLHLGQKQFPSKSNNHFNNNRNPNNNNFPPGIIPPQQQFPQSFPPQIFPEPMMSMPMQDFPIGPNIQLPPPGMMMPMIGQNPPGMMMPMIGQNPTLGMPMQLGGPQLPGYLNNQMMPPPSFGFNTQFNMPPVFYPDQAFNPMGMNPHEGRPHQERNHKKQYQMGNPNFPNLSQAQHPTQQQWDIDDHNQFAMSQQQHEQMENLMKVLEQNQFHPVENQEDEEHEQMPIPPPQPKIKKKLNLNSKPFDPIVKNI